MVSLLEPPAFWPYSTSLDDKIDIIYYYVSLIVWFFAPVMFFISDIIMWAISVRWLDSHILLKTYTRYSLVSKSYRSLKNPLC